MAAQQMIEKALLPVRLGNSKLQQSFANHVAQRLNPTGQGDPLYWKGCKEMPVVGHYDKTTNGDIMLLRSDKKDAKRLVDFVSCQHALPFVSVECDEVERPFVLKQTREPWRSPRPLFSAVARHSRFFIDRTARDQLDFARSCSHGPVSS